MTRLLTGERGRLLSVTLLLCVQFALFSAVCCGASLIAACDPAWIAYGAGDSRVGERNEEPGCTHCHLCQGGRRVSLAWDRYPGPATGQPDSAIVASVPRRIASPALDRSPARAPPARSIVGFS